MYPFNCKGSETHSFELNNTDSEYYCSKCGVSQKEYYKAMEEMRKLSKDFETFLENLKYGKEEMCAFFMYRAILKMHRTHQQDFFRILHLFIKKMSKLTAAQTDLRNLYSIEWCKDITKIDATFPRI